MLKVWIAGANGQIGRALNDVLDPMQIETLNTDLDELDITDTDEVINFGSINRPDVIINCTGITDTDECEKNPEHAYRVNALGARNLSIVARKCGAKIVQLSTDDVFDGKSKKPYTEFDDTNPLTVYGRSKRAGENYVKEFTHKHFIIRSNWVYGKGGNNFVNRVLETAEKGQALSVASDQGTDTGTTSLPASKQWTEKEIGCLSLSAGACVLRLSVKEAGENLLLGKIHVRLQGEKKK